MQVRKQAFSIISVFTYLFILFLIPKAIAQEYSPIPAGVLFNPNQAHMHALSPQGKQLAYLTLSGETVYLNIVDVDKLEIKARFNLGSDVVTQFYWIDEFRLIYNMAGRIKSVNTAGTENVVLMDHIYDMEGIDSWYDVMRHWRGWSIASMLPNDAENILLRGEDIKGYASISKFNIFTGEKTDIANGGKHKIHEWSTDMQGNVRLAYRYKKGQVEVFQVEGSEETKLLLKPMMIEGNSLAYDGRSFVNQRVFFNAFSFDGKSMYLTENIEKDKFRYVEYNLEKQKIVKVLAENKRFDIANPQSYEIFYNGFIFDSNKKQLAGIRYSAERPVTIWLDEDVKAIQATIDGFYPNTSNLIMDWTDDRNSYVVFSFSEQVPGKTSIFIKNKKRFTVVSDDTEIYVDHTLATTSFVSYKSKDGTDIYAYLTSPIVSSDAPPPLVVMPHGGPWARDYYGYDPEVQFFATRGYAVLQPQFRGSAGLGRGYMLAAKQSLNGVMLDDIADGAHWLIDKGDVDRNRVYIYGYSYGGYAAIMSAIKYKDLYKAAVSMASPLDLNAQLKFYKKEDYDFAYEYWNTLVGDAKSNKKELAAASPSENMANIKIPLLIAHGDKDPIVPIDQFDKFKKALDRKKNPNIRTQRFKNVGHGFKNPSNNIYFVEQALKMFEEAK